MRRASSCITGGDAARHREHDARARSAGRGAGHRRAIPLVVVEADRDAPFITVLVLLEQDQGAAAPPKRVAKTFFYRWDLDTP